MAGLAANLATGASAARHRLRSVCFALPLSTDAPGPAPLFTTIVGPGRARPTSLYQPRCAACARPERQGSLRRRLLSVCFALPPPPTDAPGQPPLFTATVGPGRAWATSSRVNHATLRARDPHGGLAASPLMVGLHLFATTVMLGRARASSPRDLHVARRAQDPHGWRAARLRLSDHLRSVCFALPRPTDAPGPAPLFTTTVGLGRAQATSSRDHHATRCAQDPHGGLAASPFAVGLLRSAGAHGHSWAGSALSDDCRAWQGPGHLVT